MTLGRLLRRSASTAIPNVPHLTAQAPLVTPELKELPNFLKSIETKWKTKLMRRSDRERMISNKLEQQPSSSLPRYILSMFPYPSGRLHLGHVRIYTSGDILTRYSRLLANNSDYRLDFKHVIHPMGFDSFGLPAENAARERGIDPAEWTKSNIRTMKQQLDDLSLQFDWREATSNPSFYKWTQYIFLKLFDAGLVYKSYAKVNWDPIDRTVLADEQVDEDGRSWRSGALVEKRNLRQWFIKVNAFTNDIYEAKDVDSDTWGDVIAIQRNWIGKPSGWLFYLPVRDINSKVADTLPVFTTRPELFRDKKVRLVIAEDHWLERVHAISRIGCIENPFTGGKLHVCLSQQTDDLPSGCNATLESSANPDADQTTREQVILEAKSNGLGGYYTSESYRDWLISRQRFWGTPIPIINCPNCGSNGVSVGSLPIKLPQVDCSNTKSNRFTDVDPEPISSPMRDHAPQSWIDVNCPSCNSKAERECETFDTLFDSAWYFLRYSSSPTSDKPYDDDRVQPVWCYIGGKEHAAMHLFFARFITHFLYSEGSLKFKEPFKRLLVQGVMKNRTFKLNGRYISKAEAESLDDQSNLEVNHEKMSKSKGNGVDPQELLDTYGIDATRFCIMSYANPRSERLWRDNHTEFQEVFKFLRRVTLTIQEYCHKSKLMLENRKDKNENSVKELTEAELETKKEQLKDIRNATSIEAIFNIQETNQFRQYISAMHVLLSSIRTNMNTSAIYTKELADSIASLLVMLSPCTPHLSEELWSHFSRCAINPLVNSPDSLYKMSLQVSDQPWPTPDKDYPLSIRVYAKDWDSRVVTIPIARAQLTNMSKEDLAEYVENHFSENGDSCKVYEVNKYEDLMVVVRGDIDSITKLKGKRKAKLNNL